MPVCLDDCLHVSASAVCLFAYVPVCLPACLPASLPVFAVIFTRILFCQLACLSVSQFVSMLVCLPACLMSACQAPPCTPLLSDLSTSAKEPRSSWTAAPIMLPPVAHRSSICQSVYQSTSPSVGCSQYFDAHITLSISLSSVNLSVYLSV